MRRPTSPEIAWAAWEAAVSDPDWQGFGEDGIATGFYKVRKWFKYRDERVHWSRNRWVPARIWIEPGEIDPETGELLSDERFRLEIDGVRRNPWQWMGTAYRWEFVQSNPISEEEYEWLTAISPLLPTRPTN